MVMQVRVCTCDGQWYSLDCKLAQRMTLFKHLIEDTATDKDTEMEVPLSIVSSKVFGRIMEFLAEYPEPVEQDHYEYSKLDGLTMMELHDLYESCGHYLYLADFAVVLMTCIVSRINGHKKSLYDAFDASQYKRIPQMMRQYISGI